LYTYDTENEITNRMRHFGEDSSSLKRDVVEGLTRLYNVVGTREYKLLTSQTIGAIVFENGPKSMVDHDVIIEE
ncbi:hypothetical protein Tco_1365201, partial [Tanacetum coccineum]